MRGARSSQALERLARRSIALLALPLAVCLLLVGPSHVVLHAHGGTPACGHGPESGSPHHEASSAAPASTAAASATGRSVHALVKAHAAPEECPLCLFAGAPALAAAAAPAGPVAPPQRLIAAPTARPTSPCTGLPGPRGPPALG